MTPPSEPDVDTSDLDHALVDLQDRRPSRLSLHEAWCCRGARGWLQAMAHGQRDRADRAPAWMRSQWSWGPSPWPLFLCEAVVRTELDCGALAELATVALGALGQSTCRVQLLERHDPERMAHWRARWQSQPGTAPWMWGEFAYHEAVGLLGTNEFRIWDPTEGFWLAPKASGGSAAPAAIRPVVLEGCHVGAIPMSVHWGEMELRVGEWTILPQG